MAEVNSNINLQLVLRDENLELMDLFLTNGGRSIPKLIALDKDLNILFTWGPRPQTATNMVLDYKTKHGSLDDREIWNLIDSVGARFVAYPNMKDGMNNPVKEIYMRGA